MAVHKSALLITYSDVESDSRVRHQIDWLKSDGWSIDTVGLGGHPSPSVDTHFALQPQAPWVQTRFGSILNYGVLPKRLRFRNLVLDRIPSEMLSRISAGNYDLIVFNEYDFLPLLTLKRVFTAKALRAHLHLDMHEYRDPRLKLNSLRRVLSEGYYRWRRSLIGHPAFNSRTTVASRIAEFYVDDFGFEPPAIVRNSPAYVDQAPASVDPSRIKLLFHGMAAWTRGFREILDAMPLLDQRFTMTFMLTGDARVIDEVRAAAAPFGERVTVIPPVEMTQVAQKINSFDLEIIFFKPIRRNLEFALPNKFFESVQGRLGIVVGQSPMMAEIVTRYGNGVIVDGWDATDLARTIGSLSAEQIAEMKAASDRAAADLNSAAEGRVFLASIAAATTPAITAEPIS